METNSLVSQPAMPEGVLLTYTVLSSKALKRRVVFSGHAILASQSISGCHLARKSLEMSLQIGLQSLVLGERERETEPTEKQTTT